SAADAWPGSSRQYRPAVAQVHGRRETRWHSMPDFLCGRRHLALAGEPAQKLVDLGRPQLQWMTHLVKPQVKAYPVPVTFLGANAVVMCTHQGVKLLLHARLGWLAVHVIPFTGLLYSSNGSQKISVKRIQPKAPALSQGLV